MENTNENLEFQLDNPMKSMVRVNKLHRRMMEKSFEGTGLYRAQHRTLMFLATRKPNSQAELAKALEVSTATVTVSLKKLERDGYIEKTTQEDDTRAKFVKLTEKGEEIVGKSQEIFEYVDKRAIEGISEEELLVLQKCLKRMYKNLEEIEEERK